MGKLYSLISALLLTVSATFAAAPDSYEWWFDQDVSSAQSGTLSDGKVDIPPIDTSNLPKGIHYFNLRLADGEGTYGSVYRKLFHAFGTDSGAISYEYWFDSDYASKETGSLNRGSNVLDLDISSLTQGVHYYNCRLAFGDGSWGPVYCNMFLNIHGSDNGNVNAVAYEFWIDNNYSSKTEGSVAPGANSYTIDLQGVRRGLHRFNYRIQNGEGEWGAPFTSYFYAESNPNKFSQYEYWLDNDYANRVTGNASGNPTTFEVDLSGFDKSGGAHFFNLRTRDGDGDWSPVYRKMLIFTNAEKRQPIIGYRQYLNGTDLGYVEVARQFVDSYMFDVNLPDSVYPSVRNCRPVFNGDKVSLVAGDSIEYVMQIRTELGWAAPQKWKIGTSNGFSTTAVGMAINSRHTFEAPTDLEFAAMKFSATGDSLYFRSDIPVALDIYRSGERVAALTAAQVKGMAMLRLEAGEYFGVLHSVEDAEAQNFTLHLMDTPNQVPVPHISYENETVNITCTRQDATIRYTLDGKDPDGESTLYTEPFPMKRNGTIKAKAWVDGSDITPSAVAAYTIDTYRTAAPEAEFDLPARLLKLTSETNGAIIRYTFEYDRTDSLGGVWTDYENQIQIRKNCTVYSRASFDGYKDSDITVTEITTLPDSVPMPVIEFNEGIVNISCGERDAEIHYTLDGTRPTGGSTRYAGAFPLRRNATVMAMAFVPGLDIDSSRVATRVVDSYKVATPRGSFDVSTRLLTLTCDTVGASIFHKFDSEGEWTPYSATERIRMRKNGTVYAKATYDGYNDSDVAEIVVSELPNAVVQPEILCDGNIVNGSAVVVIRCATEGAAIRYTFDDEEPSMESTLYEREFSITRNIRVNAFAYIPDLDLEPSNVSSILCDVFHVEDLRYNFDPDTRELKIECDTEGATILYTSDPNGEWTEYTGPIQIRKNCTLYAKAVCDGYHDSNTETITINSLADSVPVPEISFENGKVEISCPNETAEIHYTVDDPDLTAESPRYTEPFDLNRNAIIRAFALIPGLDIEPSDIVTKVIDSFKVASPTGSFDASRRELTLSCDTENAKIYYSFVADTQDWTEYTTPISITRNRTVYAKASRDGWNDSDVASIRVTELADNVPAPEITFTDGKVKISCANSAAEIHYTVDDPNLTDESPLYTGPFDLDRNATIRAFALIPGLDIEPSDIVTKVIDSFKVAEPTGNFDVARRELTLSCGTENAKIYYSFVADTQDWTEYTAPISITRNRNVYAKATREGWNDSEVAQIRVTELADNVPAPEITFTDGKVGITCANSAAEIHYTVDDPNLTAESPLYTGPFDLDRNATIRAFALIPGLDIEPSEVETLVINSYKVEDPTWSFDVTRRELTLSCATENAKIYYSFVADAEDWTEYTAPISITRNRNVYAKATREGWNDSEVAQIRVTELADNVPAPEITFTDGKVKISCANSAAEIHYTVDDPNLTAESPLYTGPFDLDRNATIRAFALIPGLDIEPSEVETLVINSYKVEDPTGAFDVTRRELTLSCGTENAKIYYSFVADTQDWTEYTAPISITRNRNVYAKATREGWNDSEVAQIRVTELADNVPAPEITFTDGKVEITCANSAAEIHYTIDDENLTAESPLYTGPFDLDRNATIRAFALIPGLDIEPSEVETLVINSYKVEDPTGAFDVTRRELTLSCGTENAKIYYSFVADTQDWTEYTAPISITRNRTVYAKATREGWNDSEVAQIRVTELADNVPAPEITFTDGKVEITCANSAAEIHYTIDDENLTAESLLYTGPFDLDRNATIRAFALIPGLDIEPSEVETLVINSYKVEDPTGSFDVTRRELTLSCGTENSKIYYSFVADAEDWTEYSAPISITRNRNVYAKATREGWNDSEVAQIRVTELADNVPAPEISFTDGKVEITCANTAAEIHYTIDDPNLTAESPLYTGPFDLDRNATIRAFALIPGLDIEPSEVETLVINSYKVEDPTGAFDVTRRELTLSCATENAKIYYSFVADTQDWTEYTAPISITRNRTVYAKASRDGWNDSEVAQIRVTELADNVPAPEISFTDGKVEITCANTSAEIHYTIDDENLTAESPLYTGPFDLDRNATIRAFALITGLDIEPSEPVTYVVDSYKVATPYGRFDSESRMLSILCDTENADISYSFDLAATWIPYEDMPILVESNGTVYAMATRDGYNDSEIGEIVISDVKCADVTFGEYHGRYVSLATQEEGAVIRYTTDGSEPSGGQTYTGAFDPEGLCRVRAVAVKEGYMNSDIAELVIDRYADEEHAETSAEGLLASAFGWDDTGIAGRIEDFRVEGQLNTDDYTFLRSMDALRHLDLEKVSDAHIPENAFRDSRLISISLPEDLAECGDSILSGGSLLSSVVWNSRTMNVGEGLTRGLANPNVLLYVPAETSVTGRTDLNIVREGSGPDIKLRYGYPYYAARDFRAARVSLTHEFTQTTKSDTCRGWETIVLPFSPTEITHEDRGPIVPFTAWNEDVEGEKPFWLFSATTAGWVPADYIESCVPYIISMPNNPKYVQDFNLGGKVTFSAENVDLGPESSSADSHEWVQGMLFEGTFMPVSEPTLHSLNVNSTEGGLQPGSKFVPGGTTPPFGAFVSGAPRSRAIPLFGDQGLVGVPLIVDAGLLIETPAPGVLRICSGRECKVAVTTATGVTLRTLHLMPGEAQTLEGLTRDLYIVAGRKVMVR